MMGGIASRICGCACRRRVRWDRKCQKGKREKGRQDGKDDMYCPVLLLLMPQVSYHCKNGYDYGSPDPVDILPSSCSGLCLAAIINMAFVVLTYLSPSSPDTPAIQTAQGAGGARADPQQPQWLRVPIWRASVRCSGQ
jgi:hypothetical protein